MRRHRSLLGCSALIGFVLTFPAMASAGWSHDPVTGAPVCTNGLDESGRPAPSGIYFARLIAGGRSLQTRFARLR
jgi:hypothetical protein